MKIDIKKNMINYCFELIYVLILISIMLIYKINHSTNVLFDNVIFISSIIILVVIYTISSRYINKIISMLYVLLNCVVLNIYNEFLIVHNYYPKITKLDEILKIFSYIDKKMLFITITIMSFLILISNVINRMTNNNFAGNKKYAALLLMMVVSINNNYLNDILEDSYFSKSYFQRNETDYYIYHNVNNEIFKEKFGTYGWIYKNIDKPATLRNVKEINSYISNNLNNDIDQKYKNIFKNKNVLFIQISNFNNALIDEKIMPTLNYMKDNGIYFENFDIPFLPGAESDAEFMINTSIYSSSDYFEILAYRYANNDYKITLPKIFEEAGYITEVYLNDYSVYFNRETMFSKYGYDNLMCNYDFGYDETLNNKTMVDKLKWILTESNAKRMSYWITSSNYNEEEVNNSNIEYIKHLYPTLDKKTISFMAENRGFDSSLKELMNTLAKQNRLSDYVFVIFGSGTDYSLELGKESLYSGITGIYNGDCSGLLIYNPDIKESTKIEKVSSAIDLLPTISNMFGLDYDERYVFGRNITSDNYQGFYYDGETKIMTNNYQYDIYTRDIKRTNEYEMKKINSEIKNYLEMIKITDAAIKFDYLK